ncbi:MAG: hypothetical protein NUV96_00175 [Candidatus Colwellbacteria bacterium]|nr:hypothetical protein [Candidatus Colwellbacteria bacterium]
MAKLTTTDTELVFDEGEILEFRMSHDGERGRAIWNHGTVEVPLRRTNRAEAFYDRQDIVRLRRTHGIPGGSSYDRKDGKKSPWENMLIRGNALMNAVNQWYQYGGVLEERVCSI